ncbi:MAG: serpin family protein, partial [Myxococcales bacterium]
LHKAMLGFDEVGVQAAAATAVIGDAGTSPGEPTPVKVDRSFLVGIRDEATGALLFFGRILDPNQKP